jgi:hypothetical protein
MVTEESTKDTVKTIVQGMPDDPPVPVVLPRAFLLHADHGCQPVPGLPCALSLSEGLAFAKLGRRRRRENARLWLFDIGREFPSPRIRPWR